MEKFSKLTEYQLLEIQDDFKAIFTIEKIITYVIKIVKKLKKQHIINVYFKNIGRTWRYTCKKISIELVFVICIIEWKILELYI